MVTSLPLADGGTIDRGFIHVGRSLWGYLYSVNDTASGQRHAVVVRSVDFRRDPMLLGDSIAKFNKKDDALSEKPKVGTQTRIDKAVEDIDPFEDWNETNLMERHRQLGGLARTVWGVPKTQPTRRRRPDEPG